MKPTVLTVGLLLTSIVSVSPNNVAFKLDERTSPCRIGHDAPQIGFWTWPANAQVRIFVRSGDFTPKELPHLVSGFDNWNEVSELTGSGVKFKYAGTTADVVNQENCITITRGVVFDNKRRHVTELRAFSLNRNQLITYAVIVVDPKITNQKALTEAMAHEVGHNLGLLDCYNCQAKSTVMGKMKRVNAANDLAKPTSCDIAQVRRAYAELRVRIRPSPKGYFAEDEGEEPVDDDTPIVVPKP